MIVVGAPLRRGPPGFAKYLELDPKGRDAETVKKLLDEPR